MGTENTQGGSAAVPGRAGRKARERRAQGGKAGPTSGTSPWSPLAGGRRRLTGRTCREHELAGGS